ncbi:MAG TPA: glycosyltransferase family 4 protein [Gemmatimonadota bacterium]|nr:glycosyltransferase family 4 protein [Gemmatimonadota bacterium]
MNIVFLDSWLRDRASGSGSAVAIAGLQRGLERLGHHVDVLRPRQGMPFLDLTRIVYNLSLARRIERVAGCYDLAVGFDIDGWALPVDPGARFVVALKGVAAEEGRFETGLNRIRFAVYSHLEGRNARSAERVFVTSRYAARAAVDAYGLDPRSVRIAPEAIDEDVLRRAAVAGDEEPVPTDRAPVILSVARQYRRKDTPTLLRAFAQVLDEFPAARLRIVGDGPRLPAARWLAGRLGLANTVTFTGALASTAELDREYRRARVFCLPSRQEGFGIVYLEAMAYGLPIAAAEAGAVPEVAPPNRTSLLVPPGDAGALAAALVRLLGERELAARLGSAGPARAREFDWTSTAQAFLDGLAN